MIITISGSPGSGKSTVARMVALKLGLRHYSSGDFLREIAEKRGLSLLEISRAAEKDRSIDAELDERTSGLGKNENGFVMDSRLAYHFIPDSFKVFLTVDEKEAARRVFGDVKSKKGGRKVEKESTTFAATLAAIRERKKSEQRRYAKYYKLDPYALKQYDSVIDTSMSSPEEIASSIIDSIKGRLHSC